MRTRKRKTRMKTSQRPVRFVQLVERPNRPVVERPSR